ncbi:hypothetical protein F3K02_06220 [Hydrogenophaga sp. D2P1]|uniref:Uncharacterized protein n=1 Tax=Hydrogenophaga aromaticivorans TaxID=2610898 RepID=A0A7Y8KW91_9BURK|nr:hypothetical protein [Hydrogenophaga aromaticivorans]
MRTTDREAAALGKGAAPAACGPATGAASAPLPPALAAGLADGAPSPLRGTAGKDEIVALADPPVSVDAGAAPTAGSLKGSASNTYRRENGIVQPARTSTVTTGSFTGCVVWMRTEVSASGALRCVLVRTEAGDTRASPKKTSAWIHKVDASSSGPTSACTRTSRPRPITAAPLWRPKVTA